MSRNPRPVGVPLVLELAPLPREQVGPFLLLGLDKTADKEQIEANWAQRVIWARKGQIKVPLEDINWARETISDPEKRLLADSCSLNLDTSDGFLRHLLEQHAQGVRAAGCQPLDVEKDLSAYTPPAEVPDIAEVRQGVRLPEIPREFPIARQFLEELAVEVLDPWQVDLPRG